MRALILVLLLVAFPAAAGEFVARQGDNEVRVFDAPCVHAGTIGYIPQAARASFKKATGRIDRQMFYGCWRSVGDGNLVHIVWEDGDQDVLPVSQFKPDPGT